jgi:C4-dicarboxylate-specific signal transduction histidine kinase
VKVHWTDWAMAVLLLGAGCAAVYAALSRAMRYAAAERQREMERQINAMAATVKALQGRVAELSRLQAERTQQDEALAEATAESNFSEKREKEPMTPQTLATLTAAATAFLGKKARIRSARPQAAEESATAWAQQGRVIVQTSHNMRQNG